VEYLTINEVLLLQARLIQLTGGGSGVRDTGLLESALARHQAVFDGVDLYPNLWTKAASLMHFLALSHPFVDGNKRTALAAAGIFLELNGFRLTASNDEALEFTRQVTAGRMAVEDMAAWLEAHSQVREP
jgi:death-on-curing protein